MNIHLATREMPFRDKNANYPLLVRSTGQPVPVQFVPIFSGTVEKCPTSGAIDSIGSRAALLHTFAMVGLDRTSLDWHVESPFGGIKVFVCKRCWVLSD